MSALPEVDPRNVVPAWRSVYRSALAKDIEPVTLANHAVDISQVDEPAAAFARQPGFYSALDLLTATRVLNIEHSLVEEATELIAARFRSSSQNLTHEVTLPSVAEETQHEVRVLRHRLRDDPRDAFTWVDMSLLYTNLGQKAPAVRAMELALKVQPAHRFVLRAASRLFIHFGEVERGFAVLDRSPHRRSDPLVAASHLAASEVAQKPLRDVRNIRELLINQNFSKRAISELASQFGTIEFRHGHAKRGKQLVRQSLEDPNGNVLAQAAFEYSSGAAVPTDALMISTTFSDEAQARLSAHHLDWAAVLPATQRWLDDQPFSTLAATFAGWAAGIMDDGYEQAIGMINSSLQANPTDPMLLNNGAFVDIQLGDYVAAAAKLAGAVMGHGDTQDASLLATTGLLSFRTGELTEGRAYYEQAFDILRKEASTYSLEMAQLYWAIEEVKTEMDSTTHRRVGEILKRNLASKTPELQHLANRLGRLPLIRQQ